jgi:uncharacterized phage protein (TIGR02220 family)
MNLKLPISVTDRAWYPKNRRFTEFEARIDYLILKSNEAPIDLDTVYKRWLWSKIETAVFIDMLTNTGFVNDEWYLEDENHPQLTREAKDVIELYRSIFKRKIAPSDSRLRTIKARIKEGKRLKQSIGIPQFTAVFEHQKKVWSGTEHEKYLTIETLCASKHFFKYLEDAREAYLKQSKASSGNKLTTKITDATDATKRG